MTRNLLRLLSFTMLVSGALSLSACCPAPRKTVCPDCKAPVATPAPKVHTQEPPLTPPPTKGLELPAWARMPAPLKPIREIGLAWGKLHLQGNTVRRTIVTKKQKVFQITPFDLGPKSDLDENSTIDVLLKGKNYWVKGNAKLPKLVLTIPTGTDLYAYNNDTKPTGITLAPTRVRVINVISDKVMVQLWIPRRGSWSDLRIWFWVSKSSIGHTANNKPVPKRWALDTKYKAAASYRVSLFATPEHDLNKNFLHGSTCSWGVANPTVKRGKTQKGWTKAIFHFKAPLNISVEAWTPKKWFKPTFNLCGRGKRGRSGVYMSAQNPYAIDLKRDMPLYLAPDPASAPVGAATKGYHNYYFKPRLIHTKGAFFLSINLGGQRYYLPYAPNLAEGL